MSCPETRCAAPSSHTLELAATGDAEDIPLFAAPAQMSKLLGKAPEP